MDLPVSFYEFILLFAGLVAWLFNAGAIEGLEGRGKDLEDTPKIMLAVVIALVVAVGALWVASLFGYTEQTADNFYGVFLKVFAYQQAAFLTTKKIFKAKVVGPIDQSAKDAAVLDAAERGD